MKISSLRGKLSLCLLSLLFVLNASVSFSQSVLLNGSSQYVALNNDPSLHLTDFTLEAWIKIEGTGTITASGTGSGGHANIIPIITKGRAEAESPAVDVNYFLGYDPTTQKLLADFEDNAGSVNHPVTGVTTIGNCWTHVAASYNTSTHTWKLYVNGQPDGAPLVLPASYIPQSLSNVNACIGSSFNSTNSISGFFNGRIDEVRIWNLVRTDAEILANYNAELNSGTGLVSRWGCNDGVGLVAVNSIAGAPNGILNNTPSWNAGFNQGNPGGSSLDFNGSSDRVSFGAAAGLNTSTFTLEAWIRIEGTGVTTVTSGAGGGGFEGATAAVPIVTKGRGEGESPANINMNYFMGLVGNKLAADFEEATGPNHAVIGTTVIPLNTWTHVAATYEPVSAVWNLYVNGVLDKTLDLGSNINPVNSSIQHAAVGSALNSTGVADGFFNGKIDEVRIWNTVRTATEINNNKTLEITSATGLIGRWGFNEGCGLSGSNSAGAGLTGALSSITGPLWSSGNFNNQAPDLPFNPVPSNIGFAPSTHPTICANVTDPNGGNIRVRFYGRKKPAATKFSIIGLPDTQFYTEELPGTNSGGGGHNGIFKAQTQWIADHRVDSNIAFVVQLGDCVQNGDLNIIEWKRADTAMKKIENPSVPIPDGIPYGICVGNHDQGPTGNGDPNGTTNYYNQFFGTSRFNGRAYYGGHYGSNNDNHYELFSAGGIDFIHISLEYNNNSNATELATLQPVLDWADALLKTYSNRKAILSTHNLLTTGNPASFQGPGQKIYDDLKDNPNLFLMLAGHVSGEGRRSDVFNGNTIYSLMSDYQSGYTNGGNGFLRIMQFLPAENLLKVKTYSPYNNSFMTGTGSDFSLPVTLSPSFVLIGETSVASGSVACTNWNGLDQFSEYEWYAELFDGINTINGPVWSFTTPANSPLPVSLLDFNAALINKDKVRLSWKTTFERDNDHFEVQRSSDGLHFTTIGTVAGAGNSSNLIPYEYMDIQPLKGISFYRLKQVDIDQHSAYTNIARIRIDEKDPGLEIFPNPVSGNSFNISWQKLGSERFTLRIFDANGRIQLQKQANNTSNLQITHHLAAGIYIIEISGDNFSEKRKLIVN